MSFTLSLRESYDDSADCARYCDSTNVTLLFLCPAMHMFVFIRGKNDRQLSIQSKYSVTCYKHYILQNVHSYFGILRCGSWSVVLLSVAHKSIRTPRFSEYFNNYKRVRLGAVSTPPPLTMFGNHQLAAPPVSDAGVVIIQLSANLCS